jgi:hypothetical protein
VTYNQALILQAVLAAKGAKTKDEIMKEQPNISHRIDREIKALPNAIGELVIRKPGRNGGYWLNLSL